METGLLRLGMGLDSGPLFSAPPAQPRRPPSVFSLHLWLKRTTPQTGAGKSLSPIARIRVTHTICIPICIPTDVRLHLCHTRVRVELCDSRRRHTLWLTGCTALMAPVPIHWHPPALGKGGESVARPPDRDSHLDPSHVAPLAPRNASFLASWPGLGWLRTDS